jgi:hypothetical protein
MKTYAAVLGTLILMCFIGMENSYPLPRANEQAKNADFIPNWDNIMVAYDRYLSWPASENARTVLDLLPKDKASKAMGDKDKALTRIFASSNYPILENEMFAGDRIATDIVFRLLNASDGAWMEILLGSLGSLSRINPRMFLEVLYEYQDTFYVKTHSCPISYPGSGYFYHMSARRYDFEMRIRALGGITDAKYAELKKKCIDLLQAAIKKLA